MIRIPAGVLAAIRAAARATYPEECCGILLGRAGANDERRVVRAIAMANVSAENRARRYLIGGEDVRGAERSAAAEGLDVVGFYHSHPDHPAEPSQFDLEHSWPWYVYVIVPVRAAEPGTPRAWRLAADRSRFDPADVLEE